MALHKDFPKSPYEILDPDIRWFPADEALREQGYEKLLPPLVAALRKKVKEWRDSGYEGASATSSALLKWWFQTEHLLPDADGNMFSFKYYFAQREAVETIIYLHEILKIKDKYDLLRFDSSGAVSAGMFVESWLRFVIKMATGTGKTKVLSLVLAWSFFHKLLKVFFSDPVLPHNGFEGQNWQDDFQLTLHIQDDVHVIRKTGNIFLTNIHRVYNSNRKTPSFEDDDTSDYFLGEKPVGTTNESKLDLSDIVRDIDELVILNDEAHHIHDEKLAWFKSIEDINNRLLQKDSKLSIQIDVTATPKHNNGAIFVQTVADYPLVEAIYQDVVKHPVLPDSESRAKLIEKKSSKYCEKYEDYLFETKVDLDDLNLLRNLSEFQVTKTIIETFERQINELTILDRGKAEIRENILVSKCRPFVAKEQGYLIPNKSVFNKIIGDSDLELRFAQYLEQCQDIISYVKNYFSVQFKIDYKNDHGDISNYYPDFIIKKSDKEFYVIETKGLEDLDVPLKIERLKQWCEDVNAAQSDIKYDWIFVDEESFEKYKPKSFEDLIKNFNKYK